MATPTTRAKPVPIRHRGPCGHRRQCHRPECRAEFGDIPTVEVIGDRALYYCHRLIAPRLVA